MKKSILSTLIISAFTTTAFAASQAGSAPDAGDVDTTSATIKWTAKVPTLMPGQWITFTGAGGKTDNLEANMTINADGTFASEPVVLEIRQWDSENEAVGEPLQVGGESAVAGDVYAEKITYNLESLDFSSAKGVDLTSVRGVVSEASLGQFEVNQSREANESDGWRTSWSVENMSLERLPKVIAGDTIEAISVVRADVAFANKP
ncbi:conserved exported hypothetical protein [Vibrio harveyi]|uniref:hypothetical protein n=1 Tax=Vibrio harveyi TaxID=669 RepID=UPI002AD7AE53|nr:hypothetical protein [Vibrio harveyi]CAK6716409.1 conserved exported hypothetical protein [Vibrio harveyi]